MEKKLLNNKKLFNVVKVRENGTNEITPNKKLSEIFEILRKKDKGEMHDYTLVLHYFDVPESTEICSWNYRDTELEKVQEKKKIRKLFVRKSKRYELNNFENNRGLEKFNNSIMYLLDNGLYDESKNYFESFVKEYPQNWDYFETLIIKQLTTKYSFKEFSNMNLYLYENLKKLKEERTLEMLKKKLKPNENKPDFKDSILAKEMIKFYQYRHGVLVKYFENSIISKNTWNEEKAISEILLTALIFDKLKTLNDLDLTQFYIMKENIGIVLSALKGNEKITKLVLNSNKLGGDGMYLLGRLLVYNKKIKQLDLSTTLLTDQGLHAFILAIGSDLLSLEFLNLSTNQTITQEASGRNISMIIAACPYLKTLVFNKNNMENNFHPIVRKLIDLTNENQINLTTLIATCCKLSTTTIQLLGELLGNPNCTLKSLVISDNNLTTDNESFRIFFEGLEKNRSLEELKLSNCNISNRHVDAIINLIKTNKKLASLDLYNNEITDQQLVIKILKCFSENEIVDNYKDTPKQREDDETISDESNYSATKIAYFDISKNKCKLMLNEEFVNIVKNIKLKSLDFSQNVDFGIQSASDKENFEKVVKEIKNKVKIVY
jgi:hypothetical protein